jgi:3-oxoacyl-[acyl-carrier protein] reductase
MSGLAGRRALVTGAGRGVGAEIARTLAASGAAVAVNDLYAERADAVVDEIRKAGGRAARATGDVGDWQAVQQLVAEATRALGGGIDVLVNNAGLPVGGGFRLELFAKTDPSIWEPWLRVSLYGVLHCTRAVLPGMLERGWGRVITIGSDAGLSGNPMLTAYAAAKAGAMGFTRALSKEIGRQGVTANVLALGLMERDEYAADFPLEKTLAEYPIPRMGKPSDIAPLVEFLASDAASWITGQVFAVNGGHQNVR